MTRETRARVNSSPLELARPGLFQRPLLAGGSCRPRRCRCEVSSSSVDTWRGSVPSSALSRPIAIIPKHRALPLHLFPLSATGAGASESALAREPHREHTVEREDREGELCEPEELTRGTSTSRRLIRDSGERVRHPPIPRNRVY